MHTFHNNSYIHTYIHTYTYKHRRHLVNARAMVDIVCLPAPITIEKQVSIIIITARIRPTFCACAHYLAVLCCCLSLTIWAIRCCLSLTIWAIRCCLSLTIWWTGALGGRCVGFEWRVCCFLICCILILVHLNIASAWWKGTHDRRCGRCAAGVLIWSICLFVWFLKGRIRWVGSLGCGRSRTLIVCICVVCICITWFCTPVR
jgi:hypothetical protein